MKAINFTVFGHLQSMKNSRRPSRHNPRVTHMSPQAVAFARDFGNQVPAEFRDAKLGALDQPLRAIVTVFYPSMRNDLDAALVYDLLQLCGVVANDRYIREKHEYASIDAVKPRVEIIVEEI